MEYSLVISSNFMEWRECLAAAFKSSDLFHVLGAFPTSDIIIPEADLFHCHCIILIDDRDNPKAQE